MTNKYFYGPCVKCGAMLDELTLTIAWLNNPETNQPEAHCEHCAEQFTGTFIDELTAHVVHAEDIAKHGIDPRLLGGRIEHEETEFYLPRAREVYEALRSDPEDQAGTWSYR